MSKVRQQMKKLISLAILSSVVSSLMIGAFCLVGVNKQFDGILKLVFPLLFWIGLTGEQIFIWTANGCRKQTEATQKKTGPVGFLAFCKTKEGMVADLVFGLSLALYIILVATKTGTAFLQYLSVCIAVLSFRLHCILNGKNFRFFKSIKRKVDEDV